MNMMHARAMLYCSLPTIAHLEQEQFATFIDAWSVHQTEHVFDESLHFSDLNSLQELMKRGYVGVLLFDTKCHILRGHLFGFLCERCDGHYDFIELERHLTAEEFDGVSRRNIHVQLARECQEAALHQLRSRSVRTQLRERYMWHSVPAMA